MTDKLGLEEALRKIGEIVSTRAGQGRSRARRVRSAHLANGNEEFHDQPSAELVWFVGTLIALALID